MMDVEKNKDEIIDIFKNEGNIIRLRGRTLVVGDLHGDFSTFKSVMKKFESGSFRQILFLGDYVDRGRKSKEIVDLLFEMKVNNRSIFLLRGNHETIDTNSHYGFLMELKMKNMEKLHPIYNEIFSYMPIASVINEKVFCVHGGICPELTSLEKIEKIKKGDLEPSDAMVLGMLWSDPLEDIEGYEFNFARYVGYYYGKNAVFSFLEKNKIEIILRAHQVFPEGYKWFFGDKVLSIFTSSSYISVKPKIAVIEGFRLSVEGV